jgi:tRNA(fMet)-specific endonuclease VapC
MSLQFLLDTNVLSEPVKQGPNPAVLRQLQAHGQNLATCSIVWHELLYGAARLPRSRRRTTLETYLRDVVETTLPILAYDAEAAAWHGHERARLERTGRRTSFADGQIAAIAAVNDLTLVTANTRDFAPFRGIRLVDWTDQ